MGTVTSRHFASRYKFEYAFILGISLFLISFFSMASAFNFSASYLAVSLALTIAVMVFDTYAMAPLIFKKLGYLSHHVVAALGCLVTWIFIDELTQSGIGIIGYTALGAAFRRMLLCSQMKIPKAKTLHSVLQALYLFFDFCDLLVIYFFWDIISKLPLTFQIIFYILVAVRYYINSNDLFKKLAQQRPLKQS